jgi:hypothetical protein
VTVEKFTDPFFAHNGGQLQNGQSGSDGQAPQSQAVAQHSGKQSGARKES